ncbi:MAG: TerB family tellurite resistance protein [Pirellulaceae bacterium]|jgi:uncharacterized tellurite resistance protein B-like protein|nr:TerB family tellurite resistance protein [Pirellulaceae bacterium]MDP7018672.1 TerB family tellurite resistance protein [Pirellulaceae bacterium]
MLIIGTTAINFTRDTGTFHCPNCEAHTEYRRRIARQFLTLYFVPLIPLKQVGEFVECRACKNSFRPDVIDMSPEQIREAAEIAFFENAYRIMVLIMIADGTVDEEELETIRRLVAEFTNEETTVDDIVEQAKAAAHALDRGYDAVRYSREASGQWSDEQKESVIRMCFLVATASGELMPSQNNQLQRMRFALKIDEERFRQIIERASQEQI